MANGRALPSALLFDWLLGRAWDIALKNYAEAQEIEAPETGGTAHKAEGAYRLPEYANSFDPREAAAWVAQHDLSVQKQLESVIQLWSGEFQGVMNVVAPVGPGWRQAVQWLRNTIHGRDGLGYVGQDHRLAQAREQGAQALGALNQRGLYVPAGAGQALQAVAGQVVSLYQGQLAAQMSADREAEHRRLLIDCVTELARLRNAALDASMDYMFAQVNMMFDVFGRNNDYLNRIRRDERAMASRMQVASAELTSWDAVALSRQSATAARVGDAKARNDRMLEIQGMTVEQHIKRMRRKSSQAASALNSAGVSVNSQASESNTVDAEE